MLCKLALPRHTRPMMNASNQLTIPQLLSHRIALLIALLLVFLREVLGRCCARRPRMLLSPVAVMALCTTHTVVGHKAVRDLGYRPRYSPSEAQKRTMAWVKKEFPK